MNISWKNHVWEGTDLSQNLSWVGICLKAWILSSWNLLKCKRLKENHLLTLLKDLYCAYREYRYLSWENSHELMARVELEKKLPHCPRNGQRGCFVGFTVQGLCHLHRPRNAYRVRHHWGCVALFKFDAAPMPNWSQTKPEVNKYPLGTPDMIILGL